MRSNQCSRAMAIFVLLAFCGTVLPAPMLHANMLQTNVVLETESKEVRDRLNAMLEHEDVRRSLEDRGISLSEAQARVAALSDVQLKQVAGQLDYLPSGQAVGSIVGAVVFIFLVLLITDILGLTNVFPFVADRR